MPKFKTAIWTVRSAERLSWLWNRNSDRGRGIKKLNVEQTPSHHALHIFMHNYCKARGECILHSISETSSNYCSLRDMCLKDLSATVRSLQGNSEERGQTGDDARWSSCSFEDISDHHRSMLPMKDIVTFARNWMVYSIQNALLQSNAPFEVFLISETEAKQATSYLETCRDDKMCWNLRVPKRLPIKTSMLMTKSSGKLSRSMMTIKQEAVAKNRPKVTAEGISYRRRARVRMRDTIVRLSTNPLSRISQRSFSKNDFGSAIDSNWTLWLKINCCIDDCFLKTMKAAVQAQDSEEEGKDGSNSPRQSRSSNRWPGNPIVAIVALELHLIDVLFAFQTERDGRFVFPKVAQFIRRIRFLLKNIHQESSAASCFTWETLHVRSMSYTVEVMQVTRSPKLHWMSPVADNVQLAHVTSLTTAAEM